MSQEANAEMLQIFSARLRAVMAREKIKTPELAQKSKVSARLLHDLVNGNKLTSMRILQKICTVLPTTPADLMAPPAEVGGLRTMNEPPAPWGQEARVRDALASIHQQAEALAAQVREWEARLGFNSGQADQVEKWVCESRADIANGAKVLEPPPGVAPQELRTDPESGRGHGVSHREVEHKNGSNL